MSRRKYVAGLDLGTSKVSAVLAEVAESGEVILLGAAEYPSDGLRRGVVVNIDKTVESIQAAVLRAERMAGMRIESVTVSLGGPHLMCERSRGVVAVSRPDREIEPDDVQRVVEASRAISVASDRQVIHVIPRTFMVDGQDGVKEAVGMTGQRLEVDTALISGAQTAIHNVIKCVHQAGLDVDDVVCSGLAAGEAVLTQNELDLGVCLVQIGAGTTDVVVYTDGAPLHLSVLPVGGNHVTNDIAIGLRTTLEEAEALKLNYGHTLPSVIPADERIDVRQVGGDRLQPVARRFVAEVIGPRMREIFQMAKEEVVRRSGYEGLLPAGVVVTGGAARLMGTTDAAQSVFDSSVRLGIPSSVGGLSDRVAGPSHAVAVGLARWAVKAQTRPPVRQLAAVGAGPGLGEAYQKTVRWLRDFF
ncbi:MAG TPA: cell division protein FtsA [Candidatus Dormibacteraeota bacterium]